MAYIRKVKGGWRAEVERQGVRASKVLASKEAARSWAAKTEASIIDGAVSKWPRKTVGDALDKYAEEVSPGKRSGPNEVLRLVAFRRSFPDLAEKIISDVSAADLAAWRDARLKRVVKSSVRRECNLLRNVWAVAAREWKWTPYPTPWRDIKIPADLPARHRVASWQEIRRLLRRTGYRTGERPATTMQAVGWAFLLGCRTAMRAGELVRLTGETVDLRRRVVTLETHKTAEKVGRRMVPLTPAGHRLLSVLWRPGRLLDISEASLDALYRKARDSVLIADLHFHDSRGTALTHMARKMDVMTLARISGHQELRMLLEVYYRETPEQISARLAAPTR